MAAATRVPKQFANLHMTFSEYSTSISTQRERERLSHNNTLIETRRKTSADLYKQFRTTRYISLREQHDVERHEHHHRQFCTVLLITPTKTFCYFLTRNHTELLPSVLHNDFVFNAATRSCRRRISRVFSISSRIPLYSNKEKDRRDGTTVDREV